ncbi:MAG TPA: ATP-binding protein [Steroidobacter sp.]|uniref:PAS domain-containing sensor histidine kinase n=1 Tax=Steroidobacter sp. TaxID=1978227 RepID=UPI002ED86730
MTTQRDFALQGVIDSIPAMAWSARADGAGEFFNRQYLDYVGLSLEQMRDWQWMSVIHPDDVAAVTAAWEQFRMAGSGGEVEARVRRHDGIYRWFSFRSSPVRDPDGNIRKWCGVIVDIHERKLAAIVLDGERRLFDLIARGRPLNETLALLSEVALQASSDCTDQHAIAERLARIESIAIERSRARDELRRRESLLESAERISETGSFYWDVINNKLMWSRQEYRNWELDPSLEPMSLNLLPQVHPDDRPMVEERIRRIFRGEDIPDNEERHIMPDGRIKYMRGSTRVFRYEDGRMECVGVAQDITRRRLTEQALDKVRSELAHVTRVASLGELAASIAHEVNQPLSGIITNASACLRMLTSSQSDPERAIKAVERIVRDGHRASEVIKRLRNLFRRQDFSAERFNLNEAAQEVISICSHDLQRRRIALSVDLDQALPSVVGDRIQLQQVILNLVLNAADAIGAKDQQTRQITVKTVQSTPGIAQLTVEDTGCGIAPDDLDKIFEAFYTTKPNGMGIGLSVSKSILDRHGGKLWACANEGPGSAFSFSLPCAPAERTDTIV